MTDKIVVLVTVPDRKTGEAIARHLLEARLIACAQLVPGLTSIYHWEGKIETAEEHLVIMKTRSDAFEKVKDQIVSHHPYQVPQIVSLPVERGLLPYLQWIDNVMGVRAGND